MMFACAIIEKDGKILLLQNRKPPFGEVEPGEDAREAVKEIAEFSAGITAKAWEKVDYTLDGFENTVFFRAVDWKKTACGDDIVLGFFPPDTRLSDTRPKEIPRGHRMPPGTHIVPNDREAEYAIVAGLEAVNKVIRIKRP